MGVMCVTCVMSTFNMKGPTTMSRTSENENGRPGQQPRSVPEAIARADCPEGQGDQRYLAEVEKKFQVLRDFTRSVATGRTTGLYVWGPGGCGKSRTIIEQLEHLAVPYKLFNSRMTGRGLYNTLERFPDAIHLLEDMEQLFRDSGARGVLRSGLWSQPQKDHGGPLERLVTWNTHVMEHSFVFTGGIIMTANRKFPDIPELNAIRSRIACQQLTVSDNEVIALMRKIASEDYRIGNDYLSPDECRAVCDHLVAQCVGLNRQLDLRLFVNSLSDYAQWRECEAGCDWKDLVSARAKERPTKIRECKSFAERSNQKKQELDLACDLATVEDRDERRRIWVERTGKSEQTLYRRLQQIRD